MLPDSDAVDSGPAVNSSMQDFVSISHNDMTLLIAQGYPPQGLIKNEGMLEYIVLHSEWLKINRVPKPWPRPISPCQIDPTLLEDTYVCSYPIEGVISAENSFVENGTGNAGVFGVSVVFNL